MYYILIKSYFHNVPSVSYMMKYHTIFFMNALMHKSYGTSFDYIFQKKLHYQLQGAIFDFTDVLDHNYLLVNHLLLIFKYNVYNSRVNNTLSFQNLKFAISQIKHIEETTSENDLKIKERFQISGNELIISSSHKETLRVKKIGAEMFYIIILSLILAIIIIIIIIIIISIINAI